MANLTMQRFNQLDAMGRRPINLPEDIYFGGNELLQKTPGNHHRPEYRKTGTYNHPNLKEHRKRVAIDRATRLKKNKMTEVELRKCGGLEGLQKTLAEFGLRIDENDMQIVLMNAEALEESGRARHQERQDEKIQTMAKLGLEYKPMNSIDVPYTKEQQVNDAARAKKTKVAPADDLSSLLDEDEKDGNKLTTQDAIEVGAETGVVELEQNDSIKFVEGEPETI